VSQSLAEVDLCTCPFPSRFGYLAALEALVFGFQSRSNIPDYRAGRSCAREDHVGHVPSDSVVDPSITGFMRVPGPAAWAKRALRAFQT
jgi:hypothetical protein